ncbi:MAG: hypothetical protein Q9223_004078 [Gallowayella weberi]
MSRPRVVLNVFAARQSARQPGGTWAPSQLSSRIRNRPALHTSSVSTSTGKSQPVKVQSRPSHRQHLPLAAPATSTSEARSVLDRLQVRRERLAAARSTSDEASKPRKLETWATIRQRHATRPNVGASSEKQAHPRQPLGAHRARQIIPVAEKLNIPSRQSSSERSVMTGESFSSIGIEPYLVARGICTPRTLLQPPSSIVNLSTNIHRGPLTPPAPRAVKHHDVNCKPVPFAIPMKVPLRGILKKDGQHRSTARSAVTWARQLTRVKLVDKWIGVAQELDSPAVVSNKSDHVYPDPAKYIGHMIGWSGPHGRDHDVFSFSDTVGAVLAHHAECRRPHCNKRRLHRYKSEWYWHRLTCPEQSPREAQGPDEEDYGMFNNRHGFTARLFEPTGDRLPKDVGLYNW